MPGRMLQAGRWPLAATAPKPTITPRSRGGATLKPALSKSAESDDPLLRHSFQNTVDGIRWNRRGTENQPFHAQVLVLLDQSRTVGHVRSGYRERQFNVRETTAGVAAHFFERLQIGL